jgi:hypothetical protein
VRPFGGEEVHRTFSIIRLTSRRERERIPGGEGVKRDAALNNVESPFSLREKDRMRGVQK